MSMENPQIGHDNEDTRIIRGFDENNQAIYTGSISIIEKKPYATPDWIYEKIRQDFKSLKEKPERLTINRGDKFQLGIFSEQKAIYEVEYSEKGYYLLRKMDTHADNDKGSLCLSNSRGYPNPDWIVCTGDEITTWL